MSYFILGISPYLQSGSFDRFLPLVPIYMSTGVILFYRGGGWGRGCMTKKEVLSDTIKFIINFGDILARRTLRILLAFHLPSRCEV